MTREDAITIVEMIVHSWPGQDWDAGRLEAYAQAIMPWDASATTRAVAAAVQAEKYRPPVAQLKEYLRIEQRLSEHDTWRLMPVEKPEQPLWVARWERARAADDWRLFPEQIDGYRALAQRSAGDLGAYSIPDVPLDDPTVWVQDNEYTEAT